MFVSSRTESEMNLKLNNDVRSVVLLSKKKPVSTIKEERRRTGRYIAVLVGICLFLVAIYHAWVRRIPIVASLVVPALIMFVYVGWVLYTASRDKHRLLDAEAALAAAAAAAAAGITPDEDNPQTSEAPNNLEVSVTSSKESSKQNSPQPSRKNWDQISSALVKGETKPLRMDENISHLVKPLILVNDKPPEELDLKWTKIVESVANMDKFKVFQTRRKFQRKFCRSKRNAVFKRSYSIA